MEKRFSIALISQQSVSSDWTAEALKKYFTHVDHLDIKNIEISLESEKPKVFYEGKELQRYDCIFAKGSFRYADLLRSLTTILGKQCYMPIKASAFTVGHDKLLTQLKLQDAKIPMPKTYVSATAATAKDLLKRMTYPVVMKFPKGTHGKGVMFADSYDSASSLLDALTALKQPVLIQEYIETGGVDTRVIIVGDKVVAAMKRHAVQGEKRANIHAGGKGEPVTLDPLTSKIAVQSAQAVGIGVCAVDIIEGVKGPMVIEVNLSPGLQGITTVTGIDVADAISNYLFEQTKHYWDGKQKQTSEILADLGITAEEGVKDVITNLQFRGNRILLPEIITKVSQLTIDDEVLLKCNKGRVTIKKM
ncbi:RimK family alpha-L-glutamate ligase [Candidatus Woesearchaeota archaeon]|nr:RimK family alpha-L-glutamate ligase [Candidatus Woesearchaeota archaeon]